jgi:hypothetical protein
MTTDLDEGAESGDPIAFTAVLQEVAGRCCAGCEEGTDEVSAH